MNYKILPFSVTIKELCNILKRPFGVYKTPNGDKGEGYEIKNEPENYESESTPGFVIMPIPIEQNDKVKRMAQIQKALKKKEQTKYANIDVNGMYIDADILNVLKVELKYKSLPFSATIKELCSILKRPFGVYKTPNDDNGEGYEIKNEPKDCDYASESTPGFVITPIGFPIDRNEVKTREAQNKYADIDVKGMYIYANRLKVLLSSSLHEYSCTDLQMYFNRIPSGTVVQVCDINDKSYVIRKDGDDLFGFKLDGTTNASSFEVRCCFRGNKLKYGDGNYVDCKPDIMTNSNNSIDVNDYATFEKFINDRLNAGEDFIVYNNSDNSVIVFDKRRNGWYKAYGDKYVKIRQFADNYIKLIDNTVVNIVPNKSDLTWEYCEAENYINTSSRDESAENDFLTSDDDYDDVEEASDNVDENEHEISGGEPMESGKVIEDIQSYDVDEENAKINNTDKIGAYFNLGNSSADYNNSEIDNYIALSKDITDIVSSTEIGNLITLADKIYSTMFLNDTIDLIGMTLHYLDNMDDDTKQTILSCHNNIHHLKKYVENGVADRAVLDSLYDENAKTCMMLTGTMMYAVMNNDMDAMNSVMDKMDSFNKFNEAIEEQLKTCAKIETEEDSNEHPLDLGDDGSGVDGNTVDANGEVEDDEVEVDGNVGNGIPKLIKSEDVPHSHEAERLRNEIIKSPYANPQAKNIAVTANYERLTDMFNGDVLKPQYLLKKTGALDGIHLSQPNKFDDRDVDTPAIKKGVSKNSDDARVLAEIDPELNKQLIETLKLNIEETLRRKGYGIDDLGFEYRQVYEEGKDLKKLGLLHDNVLSDVNKVVVIDKDEKENARKDILKDRINKVLSSKGYSLNANGDYVLSEGGVSDLEKMLSALSSGKSNSYVEEPSTNDVSLDSYLQSSGMYGACKNVLDYFTGNKYDKEKGIVYDKNDATLSGFVSLVNKLSRDTDETRHNFLYAVHCAINMGINTKVYGGVSVKAVITLLSLLNKVDFITYVKALPADKKMISKAVYDGFTAVMIGPIENIENYIVPEASRAVGCILAHACIDRVFSMDYMNSTVCNNYCELYEKMKNMVPSEIAKAKVDGSLLELIHMYERGGIKSERTAEDNIGTYNEAEKMALRTSVIDEFNKLKKGYNDEYVNYVMKKAMESGLRASYRTEIAELCSNMFNPKKDMKLPGNTATEVGGETSNGYHVYYPKGYGPLTSLNSALNEPYSEIYGIPFINIKHPLFKQIAIKYKPEFNGKNPSKKVDERRIKKMLKIANKAEKQLIADMKKGSLFYHWLRDNPTEDTAVEDSNKPGFIKKLDNVCGKLFPFPGNHAKVKRIMKLIKQAYENDEVPVTRKLLKVIADPSHSYKNNPLISNTSNDEYAFIRVCNMHDERQSTAISKKYIKTFYAPLHPLDNAADYVAACAVPNHLLNTVAAQRHIKAISKGKYNVGAVTDSEVNAFMNDVSANGDYPYTFLLTANPQIKNESDGYVKFGLTLSHGLVGVHVKFGSVDGMFIMEKKDADVLFG